MYVKQLSIFVENKPGRLAEITKLLSENEVDIRAVTISDTTDYGILRIIVNDPEKASAILKENSFTCSITEVLAIVLENKVGYLSNILELMFKNEINVEYTYASIGIQLDRALLIMKVSDLDAASALLKNNDVTVLTTQEVYSLWK